MVEKIIGRMDAAAAFTDATNAKALSEQPMDSKAGVRKALSFPDWTVSKSSVPPARECHVRKARGNMHRSHFQADTVV